MKLKFDYANMTSALIGEQGIDANDIKKDTEKIDKAFESVIKNADKGHYQWTSLPFIPTDEIKKIIDYCAPIRKKADSFVVMGIGGSALGCLSAANALLHFQHNTLSRKQRKDSPRFYVMDNIDPERLTALLDVINIKKSYFNFVTKSGETPEALCQFLIIYDILKRLLGKKKAVERITITTTDGKGSLYDVAVKEGFKIFGIPEGVGGRFSVFSNVGLLPMAAAGINITMVLKGAAEMDEVCRNADIYKNPALMSAYMMYKAYRAGKNISVMMPYSDALKFIPDFYAQLWGESLGKEKDLDGNTVNVGQTPVKALGVTDQHSQIQLYMEGPFDKVVTFIAVDEFREKVFIPDDTGVTDFAFLKGKNLSDVLNAERQATAFALTKAKRGNFTITMPCVCEYTIGELLTYFMYQTVYMGAFLNINPYGQPGVEAGKQAAFAVIGRVGYEKMLDEIKESVNKEFMIEENEK